MRSKDSNFQVFPYAGQDPTVVKRLKSLETTIERNGRATVKAMQLTGRRSTVVLSRRRYRSKSSAPCKVVTLNHRRPPGSHCHFGRGNFSAS